WDGRSRGESITSRAGRPAGADAAGHCLAASHVLSSSVDAVGPSSTGWPPAGEGAMHRPSLPILALVAMLSGCSKHATDSTGPPQAPPVPELVAMQPPARSPSALYDSDIWAQFDRPLDPHTVTALNVYLKLDAQRLPITVSYDAATQRVSVTPTVVLELQR